MLSGKAPFQELGYQNQLWIAEKVCNKDRPKMPLGDTSKIRGLTSEWWALISACWAQEPHERPDASTVLRGLRSLPNRKGDRRSLADFDEISQAKTLFRLREDNPFAPLIPVEGDHHVPGLFELKDELALGNYY